jgi:hypothetical protein
LEPAVRANAGGKETKKLEGKEPANNGRTRNGTSQRFMAYHFFFRLHKTTDIAFPFWSVKKTFYRPRTSETQSTFENAVQDGRRWRFSSLRSKISVTAEKSVQILVFRFRPSDDQMNYFGCLQHCSRSFQQISNNNVDFLFLLWSMIGGSW